MTPTDEHELNQTAYRRLKSEIDQKYEAGRYVALAGGRIVADSDEVLELHARLRAEGFHTPDVLVIQARVERLDSAFILLSRVD